jgi:hypothetical protein
MHRRVASALLALAVAACGEAFTAATGDGSAPDVDASSTFDTGAPGPDAAGVRGPDGAVDDAASGGDAKSVADATSHDATAGDGGSGKGDGSIGVLDGGPVLPDAGICVRTCPAGFDCIASKCEDHAATHFSATSNRPFNWAYGYSTDLGGAFMLDTVHWTPLSSIDVWATAASSLEPSVFHNSGLASQMYAEMTIPGVTLGLYPGATTQVSIVRWIAPAVGYYAIDATFTGISAPLTTVSVGILVNEATTQNGAGTLNEYGGGNTFTYSAPSAMMTAGTAVDFYVQTVPNRDDPPGGASLDAKITAE